MNHFKGITTLDELKKRYKTLAKVFHPDMPNGNTAIMQEVNNQYDKLFMQLKQKENSTKGKEHQTTEMADDYKNIINALMEIENIEVELCGSWLWIKDTFKKNDIKLKKAGCGHKKSEDIYYWRPNTNAHHGKSGASMESIRTKYGSESIRASKPAPRKIAV